MTQKAIIGYSIVKAKPGDKIGPYLNDSVLDYISWGRKSVYIGGAGCWGIIQLGNLRVYFPVRILKNNDIYYGYIKLKEAENLWHKYIYIEKSVLSTKPNTDIIVEE